LPAKQYALKLIGLVVVVCEKLVQIACEKNLQLLSGVVLQLSLLK